MKDNGVSIAPTAKGYNVKAVGRANFDYAVPIRELTKKLDGSEELSIDLSECTAMDSTFMGVLSMIGLKSRRSSGSVTIACAADNLKALLKGLGVAKLFNYVDHITEVDPCCEVCESEPVTLMDRAETVLEAHQKLVEADDANAEKFAEVIEFAKDDVERVKNQE